MKNSSNIVTLKSIVAFLNPTIADATISYRGLVIPRLMFAIEPNSILTNYQNCFLALRDSDKYSVTAICNSKIFRDAIQKYDFTKESNLNVTIGSIGLDKFAKLTITITDIKEDGVSDLELEKQRIKKYCKKNNYYSYRNMQLPLHVNNIAIITTSSGNTASDIINQIGLKSENISLFKCASNAQSIASTLKEVVYSKKYQLALLFRGGNEDAHMINFSLEPVLDEVIQSPILVASAIGHESDTPIVQSIVDIGFDTPTSFAKHISEHNERFSERLTTINNEIIASSIDKHREMYRRVLNHEKNIIALSDELIEDRFENVARTQKLILDDAQSILTAQLLKNKNSVDLILQSASIFTYKNNDITKTIEHINSDIAYLLKKTDKEINYKIKFINSTCTSILDSKLKNIDSIYHDINGTSETINADKEHSIKNTKLRIIVAVLVVIILYMLFR